MKSPSTTPDPPACPRWCDRADCARRGRHQSRARHVETARAEAYVIDLSLTQSTHPAGEPLLLLTGVDDATVATLTLSLAQGAVLRYRLAALLDVAKIVSNQRRWS
ncbi:hypothetical protein ACN26Y_17250 [Micromonospora sp. WMMD558]|uniref:hypothetical protein n=1 Tax=Micromonospora sp. WMMD558 TaxID=3403462 RepID=UPI003BF4C2B5